MYKNTKIMVISKIILAFLAIVMCLNAYCQGISTSKKPNIIFVLADQLRLQSTGYSGDSNSNTPNIDRLAGESINFLTTVSTTPVCCPYRASLLTGQYPLTHGVFMNDVPLNPSANSMGKIFKNAGFNTAYIGKWHLDGNGRSEYIPPERRQGFDYWKVLECTHDYNNSYYFSNKDSIPSKWEGYDAYYQTIDAQQYINDHANDRKPFLLVLSWGSPHEPYGTAPEKYNKLYKNRNIQLRPNVPDEFKISATNDLKGYYAHINALDDCIAMLLKTIKMAGIESNTIFIFTSDHGDMLYSQGVQKKQQPYDESIRVPFLLRYPAVLNGKSKKIETPLSTPDILPTLLSLCNIEIPNSVEGQSFASDLKNNKRLHDNNALLMSVTPFGQWIRADGGVEYRGIRTMRYTYVRKLTEPWLLFDNFTDPYQQNNLIKNIKFSKLAITLENSLRKKLQATKDEFLSGKVYIEKWGYKVDDTGTVPYKN